MGYLRLWVSYAILFAVLATAEEKSGKVKPYEFGYIIEGQQHRYEKRDENGVITGDFGFVTGDGVYHATQFAADETGKFRITATRTLKIGLPGQPGSIPIPRDLFLRSDYFKLRDIKTSNTAACSDCLVQKKPKPSVTEPKPFVKMTVKQKSDTVERTMTLEVVKLPSPKRVDPSPADVKRKEFAPVVHPPDAINPVNLFKPFVRKTETDSKSPTRSPEAKPKSFIPTSDNGGNIVQPPKSVDIPDSKILKLTIDTETQPKPFTLTDSSRAGKSFNINPPSETVPATESPILFIQPISKPKSSTTQISGKAQTAAKTQTQGTLGQNDLPHLKPVAKFIPETIPVIKGSADKVPVLEKGIVPTPFDPVHTHLAQFKVDHGKAQTSSEGKNSVVLEDISSLVSDSPVNTKVHQTKPSKVDSELANLVEPESRKSLEQIPHLPLKPVVVELHKESLKPSLESSNPIELPSLSISSSPRDSGEFEERLHDGDVHDVVPPSVSQYKTSRQRPLKPSRKQVLSTNLPAKPSTSVTGSVTPHKNKDDDDESFVHQTSDDGDNGVNKDLDSEEPKSPPKSDITKQKILSLQKPPALQEEDIIIAPVPDEPKSPAKSRITKPEVPSFKKPLVLGKHDDSRGPIYEEPKSSPESEITRPEAPIFKKPLVIGQLDISQANEKSSPKLSIKIPTDQDDSKLSDSEGPKSSPKSEIAKQEVPRFKKPLAHREQGSKSSPKSRITEPEVHAFEKPLEPTEEYNRKSIDKSSSKSGVTTPDAPSFKAPLVLPEEEDSKGHVLKEPKLSPDPGITRLVVPSFKKPLVPRLKDTTKTHEISPPELVITKPETSFTEGIAPGEQTDSEGPYYEEPKTPELGITKSISKLEIAKPEVPSFRKPLVPRVQDNSKVYEKSASKSGVTKPGAPSFKAPLVLPEEAGSKGHVLKEPKLSPDSGITRPVVPSFKKPLVPRLKDTTKTHEISPPELVITKPGTFFTEGIAPNEQTDSEGPYSQDNSEIPVFEERTSPLELGITKPEVPSFKKPEVLRNQDDNKVHVSLKSKSASKPEVPSFRKPLIPRVQESSKVYEESASKSGVTKPDAPSFKTPHVLPEEEGSKGHVLKEPKLSPDPGITRPVVPSFKKPLLPRAKETTKTDEISPPESVITKPESSFTEGIAPGEQTDSEGRDDYSSKVPVSQQPKSSSEPRLTKPIPSFKKPLLPQGDSNRKSLEEVSSKSGIKELEVEDDGQVRISEEPTPHSKLGSTKQDIPSFRKPLIPRKGAAVPVTPLDEGVLDLSSYEMTTTGSFPAGSDRMQSPKEAPTVSSVRGKPTTGVSRLNGSVPRRKGMRRKIIKRPGSSRQTGKNGVSPLLEDVLTDTVTPKPIPSTAVPTTRLNPDTYEGNRRRTGNGPDKNVKPYPTAAEIDQTHARKTNTGVSKLEISSLPEKETSKKRTKTPSAPPQIIDKIIVTKPTVTETYNTPATTARIDVSHDIEKSVISIPSTSEIQDSSLVNGDDLTTSPTPKSTIANGRFIPTDKQRPKVFNVPGISKTQGGRVRPSRPEIKDVLTTRLVQKPTVTEVSQTPSTETNLGADDLTQDVVELEVPSPDHDGHSAPSKKPKDGVSELGFSLTHEKDDQRKVVKVPPLVFKDILTTVIEPNPTILEVSQPNTEKPQTENFEIQIPKSSDKIKPEKVGQTRKTRVKGKHSATRSSNKGRAKVPPLKHVRVSPTDKTTEALKTLKFEMDSPTPRDRIVAYVTEIPVKVDMTVRGSRKEIDNFVTHSAPKHVPETATEPTRIHISENSGETELPSIVPMIPVTPSSFPLPIRSLDHNHDDRDPSDIVSSRREGKELTIDKSPFVDGNTNKIHSQISNSDTQSTIIPTLISGSLQDSKARVTGHPSQVPRPHVSQKVTGTLESGLKVPSIPKSDSTKSPVTFDKIDIAKPKPTPTIVTSSFPIKSSPTPSHNKPINQARDRDQATSAPVVQAPTLKPLAVEQSSALPPSRDPLLPTAPRDTEEAPYKPTPAPKQGTTSSERDSRKLFQVPSGDLQKLSLEDQTVLPGIDVRLSFGGTDTEQPTRGPQRPQFGVLKTEDNYAIKPIKFDSTPKGPKIAPALVQKVPDTFSQPKTLKIEVTTLPPPVVPVEQPNLSPRDPEPARFPQPTSPTRSPSLSSRIAPTKEEKFVPKSQVLKPKSSIKSTPQQFEPTLVPVTQTQAHNTEEYTKHKTDTLLAQGLPGRLQLTRPSAHLPPVKPAKQAKFVPKSQVNTTPTGKTPTAPKPAVQLTTGQFEPVTQAPEGYTTDKTDTQKTEGVTGTGRLSTHLPSVKQTKDEKFVPRPQVSTTTSEKTSSVPLTQQEFEHVTVTQTPQEYITHKTATPQTQGLSGTGPSVKSTQDKKFVSKSHASKPKPSAQSTPPQFEPVTLTHPSEGHPAHKTDTPQAQSLPGTAQPTRPAAHLPAPKPAPAPKLVSGPPHTAPPPAPDARGPVHSTHLTQTFTEAPTRLPSTAFKSDLKNVEIKSVSGGLVTSKPAAESRSPSSKVLPTAPLGLTPSSGGKPTEAQKPSAKPQLLDGGVQTSRGSPTTPRAPLEPKPVPQAGGTPDGSTGRRPVQQTKTQSDRQPVSKPGSEGAPRVSKPKITDSPQTSGLDTRFSLEGDSGNRQQRPKPVLITPLATGDRQGRKGFGDEKPSTGSGSGRVSEGASRGSVKHRTSSLGGILYRFNYTVGYHGHHEQGDTIGNKDGGYEFVGRDGVLRRVDYVANEFGYQPHVSQHTVAAERTPKEETEKEAGLKGYEFKWFNPE